jgi:hypothetical protein
MRLRIAALSLLLVLPSSAAFAGTITFSFAGQIDFVDPALSTSFGIGDPLSGEFVFDSNAVASANCLDIPLKSYCTPYESSLQHVSGTLGDSYHFTGNVFVALVTPPAGLPDTWGVVANPPLHLSSLAGPAVNGDPLFFFSLNLGDPSGTALGNDLVPPVFENYAERQFMLGFLGAEGLEFVGGSISSLAATGVPEPASAVLLVAGLSLIAPRRRHRALGSRARTR